MNERRQVILDNKLAITNDKVCMKYFGDFPVLYVDFSVSELICQFPSDADSHRKIMGTTFKKLQVAFRQQVTGVAENLQKQGLLAKLDNLQDFDRNLLKRVMNGSLPADEWEGALKKLTAILHAIHKRDVIVLIDEYDTPMAHGTQYGYFSEMCPSAKFGLDFSRLVEGQRVLPQYFSSSAQGGSVYIPSPIIHLNIKF